MGSCIHLEERLRAAVVRAYAAAGLTLPEKHVASLASVYAEWGADAGDALVERIERALAASLGVRLAS